jgi:hypothetical protein
MELELLSAGTVGKFIIKSSLQLLSLNKVSSAQNLPLKPSPLRNVSTSARLA